ncbi:MAG: glycoside hydrolase family 3 C-terminal domain-containing protein [Bacteroidetes bacterium]|uniref:Glycoside hydrolase family 3 C-terminal domain-containing protein n=1 Tax=Candidatus Cryptobacteroides merdigallinarum TaxID=2840770 RepID=A0A9D9HBV8_9BACT|nr:glycoside hydrolase family 3 C-terminal domain-containing protein [Candidatus Cryptobacteroides merdigallinarum]
MRQSIFAAVFVAGISVFPVSAQGTDLKTPPPGQKVKKFEIGDSRIYRKGWIDFNKNGRKDVYEDPAADIEARVEDLLSRMTLDEKTCQMVTLYGYQRVLQDDLPTPEWKEKLWKDGIGAIDEHLNGFKGWGVPVSDNPNVWPASRHAWALNEVQRFFVEETRLGIPVDFTNEGIRGVESYRATNFPTQLGIGHTWNRDLVRQIGRITGREGHLLGYTNIYAPILDVGRDQRWGRYEEVYGEDPYLVAELGVAMVQGLQEDYQVAATGKHFAIYSNNKGAREGMARVDPQTSPHEVENIHLYPWREVIRRAGLLGVMSSYNDYDGEPVQGSRYWLTERLREDFGFNGYVVSDSDAVEYLYMKHHVARDMKEAVRQSVEAGLNVRCTFRSPDSYVLPLRELVQEGTIPESLVDDRVRDILRVKFLVGLFDDPYQRDYIAADEEVDSPENNLVALQASRESIVLLKNEDNVLPLDPEKLERVAVIGPNADETTFALTHYGPLATEVTSVLEGLRSRLDGLAEVVYAKGCDLVDYTWPLSEIIPAAQRPEDKAMIAEAVAAAESSDVAVVVLGGGQRTCGENKSRTSLELPGFQNALLEAVVSTGKPVVVVLINGRPLSVNYADACADAILEAWYPGAHGGQAIAEVICGDYNPGGKLTVTFPKTVGQIPFNFPYKPNSQVDGNRKPGTDGNQTRINGALYDFGYGLSYTTFKYSDLTLSSSTVAPGEPVTVEFNLTNTGKRAGDEVVQLYIHDKLSSITVYEKQLRGFERVHLEAGETARVRMTLAPEAFSLLDRNMKRVVEPGEFDIMIGASSTDIRLQEVLTVSAPGAGEDVSAEAPGLPEAMERGDEVIFTLAEGTEMDSIVLTWSGCRDCRFEILATDGGGQFLPVHSAAAANGQVRCTFPPVKASELKITVTSGSGTLEKVECRGLAGGF